MAAFDRISTTRCAGLRVLALVLAGSLGCGSGTGGVDPDGAAMGDGGIGDGGIGDGGIGDAPAVSDAQGGPQYDAGSWSEEAALWRYVWLRGPTCVIPTDTPGFMAGSPTLVIARSVVGGVQLRVSMQSSWEHPPEPYPWFDALTPALVMAHTEPPAVTDGGIPYTPYVTATDFLFSFVFVPKQPPLALRRASIEGALGVSGLPVVEIDGGAGPWNRPWNILTGCATEADADEIYVEVVSQTLQQLMVSSGCQLDCSSTGGDTLDGYLFEFALYGNELVTYVDPEADGGV